MRIGEFNVNVILPTTTTTTTTTTTAIPTSTFNRSARKLDLDYSSYDIDTLPNTTRLDLSLEKATGLPLVLSLVLIVIIISVITILVLVHKMKNGSVNEVIKLEAGQLNTSFEEPKGEKDEKVMEEVLFMRKAFPHIINFPSDDLGLNL